MWNISIKDYRYFEGFDTYNREMPQEKGNTPLFSVHKYYYPISKTL